MLEYMIPQLFSLASSYLGFKGQQQANQTNIAIAETAAKRDQENFEKTLEFNYPKNQMLRLYNAGLNPNLVYGSGNVVGNSTGDRPRQYVPTISNEMKDITLPNALTYLNQYQDYRVKSAQENSIDSTTKLNELEAINKAINTELLNIQVGREGLKLNQENELYKTQIQSAITSLEKLQQEKKNLLFLNENVNPLTASNMSEENKRMVRENRLNDNLAPYQSSMKDSFLSRMLISIFRSLSSGASDLQQDIPMDRQSKNDAMRYGYQGK